MTFKELKEKLNMDKRVGKVKCYGCGKEIEVPNMYSQQDRNKLVPYCCATTILLTQWLIHHGWHVTTFEANPSGKFFCPDCFPEGTPEYSKRECGADWCEQAERWMKENNGRQ